MNDRGEMISMLSGWMRTGHEHFVETGQQAKGRHLLKTYLVEANAPAEIAESDGFRDFFESLELATPVQITPTSDPTIHQIAVGKKQIPFYVDTLDTRFWLVHSTASATDSDVAIQGLVQKTRLLDSVWLPTRQFESWISEAGTPRIMTAKFAVHAGLYRDTLPEDEFLDDSLLFKIGASANVMSRWEAFRRIPEFQPMQALWSARVHRRDGDEYDQAFSIDDITAAGKVTARGNSFIQHDACLREIMSRYKALITEWEEKFRVTWTSSNNGFNSSGEVVQISWPDRIEGDALGELVSRLFNCGEPYRLYGVPLDRGRGRVSVQAVDLHTGDRINFEILPSRMWVHLYPSSCGNVLARLLTNLQHYHDARTELHD